MKHMFIVELEVDMKSEDVMAFLKDAIQHSLDWYADNDPIKVLRGLQVRIMEGGEKNDSENHIDPVCNEPELRSGSLRWRQARSSNKE